MVCCLLSIDIFILQHFTHFTHIEIKQICIIHFSISTKRAKSQFECSVFRPSRSFLFCVLSYLFIKPVDFCVRFCLWFSRGTNTICAITIKCSFVCYVSNVCIAVNRSSSASSMRRITPPTSSHVHPQELLQYQHQQTQQCIIASEPAFDEGRFTFIVLFSLFDV